MAFHRTSQLRLSGSVLFVFCVLALHSAAETAGAPDDEIDFVNGDRLSGQLIRLDGEYIQLQSNSLGLLKVAWTNVAQVKSHGRTWRMRTVSDEAETPFTEFKNAVLKKTDDLLVATFDSQKVEIPQTASVQLGTSEHKTAGPLLVPAVPSKPTSSSIDISLNSPISVVDGTSSSENFGGTVRFFINSPDLCKPASWFSSLKLMANHSRAWKVKSPAVVTDTFDGNLTLSHGLDAHGTVDAYMSADVWGNSSLGVGLQQSYGGGLSTVLYSTNCLETQKTYRLTLTENAGLRYVHQRLYAPGGGPLDLAGARTETALTYQPLKRGTRSALLTVEGSLWAMPMLGNERAIQAGGSAGIILPLGKSISLSLTEEDDFVNNAPKARRKNYLKSGATLTVAFPAPPTN